MIPVPKCILLLIVNLFVCAGCVCRIDPEQERWEVRHARLGMRVVQGARKGETPLVQDELLKELGSPDQVTTVGQLESRLRDNEKYHKEAMESLWHAYLMCQDGTSTLTEGSYENSWQLSDAFLDYEVWLYDESRHFSHPLFEYCCFCADTGFGAHIYFVQDSNVTCAADLIFWERASSP